MRQKHKFEHIADSGKRAYEHGKSTPLDKQLKRYAFLGERVLSFWRDSDGWTFKVMA